MNDMTTRWSTCCAAVAACALASCTAYKDFRDWWTEDLRGPRHEEWAEGKGGDEEERARVHRIDPNGGESANGRAARPNESQPPAQAYITQPPRSSPLEPQRPARPSRERSVIVQAPTPRAPREASPAAVPIIPPLLASIAGMSEAGVRQALGPPTTALERGAQKIWRYAGDGCSVEVIFFLDVTRNTYAALAHKTLNGDGRSASSAPCLRSGRAPDPDG